MKNIGYEQVKTGWNPNKAQIFKWSNLKKGDGGVPVACPTNSQKTIQVKGIWGQGRVQIEGSLDAEEPITWVTLRDNQTGFAKLIFTAAGGADIRGVLESTYLIRPVIMAGDDTTDLTVSLLIVR